MSHQHLEKCKCSQNKCRSIETLHKSRASLVPRLPSPGRLHPPSSPPADRTRGNGRANTSTTPHCLPSMKQKPGDRSSLCQRGSDTTKVLMGSTTRWSNLNCSQTTWPVYHPFTRPQGSSSSCKEPRGPGQAQGGAPKGLIMLSFYGLTSRHVKEG